MVKQIKNTEGFLIDLDGSIFKGNEVVDGARDVIKHLQSLHSSIVFLSNRGNR